MIMASRGLMKNLPSPQAIRKITPRSNKEDLKKIYRKVMNNSTIEWNKIDEIVVDYLLLCKVW